MPEPPSGTVTFLFSDVEGSTRRWEQHPEAMRAALARHDELMRAAIREHGGHVVKTMGDAFHAAFSRAPDAVAAAFDAQARLQTERWAEIGPELGGLRVRMALHTGVAEERDGDYYGPTLNRAARLTSIGHGGQILLSEATATLVREQLPNGASLLDVGEHRLKDLSAPERVHQLAHPALVSDFPPLRSLDGLPNNLPRQLTSFVGREQEMAEVKRLLAATSLLTLVGTGGAGKTRLSLQVAADLVDEYRDGVWLVELAPLAEPALVAQAVASAVGVREQAGRSMLQTLAEHLRTRELLLVLDNCEHLVGACAALADTLLRASSGLEILATSREALGVPGETTWRVPSLTMPDPDALSGAGPEMLATLTQHEAVRLFIERAVAVRPDFTVTNQSAPSVAQICHRLDGVPLAIELAAARIRVLTPEQIAARLDDRFRLLTGGSRTVLPRQQTLRALVDWSYDLLSEAEQTLLQRLSVFSGGWTLDAAEAICSGGATGNPGQAIEPFEVLDLLAQLVDKSIVIADVRGDATRYRLLETLRQYGAEKLIGSGDAERLGRAHRDWFLDLAERAVVDFWGPDLAAWISLLHADHDNLRAALGFTLAHQDEESVEIGLRLAAALGPFWWVRSHVDEGCSWLERALGDGGTGDRPPDAGASLPLPPGPPRHFMGVHPRVAALNMLSACEDVKPAYEQARRHAVEAQALAENVGDSIGLGNALIHQANVSKDQGRYEESVEPFEASLRLLRSVGHRWSIWRALVNLGETQIHLGNLGVARQLLEESLPIARSIGLDYGVANGYRHLGTIAYLSGDLEQATSLSNDALVLYRRLGAMRGPGWALNQMGHALLAGGDHAGAEARFREALVHMRDTSVGVRDRYVAVSFEGLAGVALAAHDGTSVAPLMRAARLLGAAYRQRERTGAPLRPVDRPTVELTEAAARGRRGDAAYAQARSEGEAMTIEEAIAYALSDADRV